MPERLAAGHACEDEARAALLAACSAAAAGGGMGSDPGGAAVSVPVASACLSLRWRRSGGPGFLITAKGSESGAVRVRDRAIAWMPLQAGERPAPAAHDATAGPAAPAAAEWRLHHALYLQRPDVEAIIRCRPTCATTLACSPIAADGIPAFHPDVQAAAGGAIPRVECGLPGSTLRPERLIEAVRERHVWLLAGWGLLACGASLPAAALRAAEVEALARIWWHLLQLEQPRARSSGIR
jgi:ribulose-5-phosphate 4-epimerase/fuculose-1-phosphate aldolase